MCRAERNYRDVAARAADWMADIKADTFAVSHGALSRILRGLLLGLSLAGDDQSGRAPGRGFPHTRQAKSSGWTAEANTV